MLECQPSAATLPSLVRCELAKRYATAKGGFVPNMDRVVSDLVAWLRPQPGDPATTLALVLDGYFADPYATREKYPLAFLTKDPARFLPVKDAPKPLAKTGRYLRHPRIYGAYWEDTPGVRRAIASDMPNLEVVMQPEISPGVPDVNANPVRVIGPALKHPVSEAS